MSSLSNLARRLQFDLKNFSRGLRDLPPLDPPPAPPVLHGVAYAFGARHVPYVAGVQPNGAITRARMDSHCTGQYTAWKGLIIRRGLGGRYPAFGEAERQTQTVSEGVGYAMLLAVLFAGYDPEARVLFDDVYRVATTHPAYASNEPALMDWKLDSALGGNASAGGGWFALDGDLDIALALLMASKQWGNTGATNYQARALAVIEALQRKSYRPDGASLSGGAANLTRMSDYMTGHYKAFKKATNDAFWDVATNKAFFLYDRCQAVLSPPPVSLVPDFLVRVDTNTPTPDTQHLGDDGSLTTDCYSWNSCRVPFRMGCDYLISGDDRARNVGSKLVDFFTKKHNGNLRLMTSGYRLNGDQLEPQSSYHPEAFISTLLPAAMGEARFQTQINQLWNDADTRRADSYYSMELQLLSQVVAAGNWWAP